MAVDPFKPHSDAESLEEVMRQLYKGVYIRLRASSLDQRGNCGLVVNKPKDVVPREWSTMEPRDEQAAKGFPRVYLLCSWLPCINDSLGDRASHA